MSQKAAGEKTLWGIHGGKTGDADNLFLKHNVIALGWTEMGDMSKLGADRDAFKAKLLEVRPDRKPGYYPNAGGQLFRFVHEAKNGDLVVYPSKRDRHIHIGEITGPYKYDASAESSYPQQRAVKWLKSFPRTKFSQGALYETGSAMSFFQVKNYSEEFLAALAGQGQAGVVPPKKDETIPYVVKDIAENTRDFILKTLAQESKGHPFEDFVAHLLEKIGYRTRLLPLAPGIDIIAHRDELGFEPPLIKVQVKSSEDKIGDAVVSQLYGKVGKEEFGLFVTLGTFTDRAITFAHDKGNLRLIDGEELVGLILQHYEQFDSVYKGLLPLTRVYVPEPLEEAET